MWEDKWFFLFFSKIGQIVRFSVEGEEEMRKKEGPTPNVNDRISLPK